VRLVIALFVALAFRSLRSQHHPAPSAVVSNAEHCADIGMAMLDAGGSAVDAAIATMFCEGVSTPQSLGIGGGFVATIYDKASGTVECIDSREVAPAAATEDMFVGNEEAAVAGGLAIAVPGEVSGYWELHRKYGKLPWKALVAPSIELCKEGVLVNGELETIFTIEKEPIMARAGMVEVFVNPATNDTWKRGDRFRQPALAETLKVIAEEGADALYSSKGSLLPKLMQDLRDAGSILTEDDFYNYRPNWTEPAKLKLRAGFDMYSVPLPASGDVLKYIFSLLDGFDDLAVYDPLSWHRIIESFKHAYGIRTHLGDPRFVNVSEVVNEKLANDSFIAHVREMILNNMTFPNARYYGADFSAVEDHGTAHSSFLAGNGDAVAITSTINYFFGSMILSPSTGIILNDEMDDFSTPGSVNVYGLPPSPANFIAPGKRPLSSMTPTVVIDRAGDVRMIVGAAGGSKITTATTQLILRHLYFGQSLCDAIAAPRLHHQLLPMRVEYEQGFDPYVLTGLAARGHAVVQAAQDFGFTAVTAIVRQGSYISASYDKRRGGSVVLRSEVPGQGSCE
uniref:Gamma-glutamyltransferase n=1 Tax=Anopheles dirus TaxID=7168 RepID=A0A182N9R3_9DIPT